jgi:hypothetical protein
VCVAIGVNIWHCAVQSGNAQKILARRCAHLNLALHGVKWKCVENIGVQDCALEFGVVQCKVVMRGK